MIRIAAVADVHLDQDVLGRFRPAMANLPEQADVLLLGGDLTRHGTVEEMRCVATEFGDLGVPVVAVLGNHDHHGDQVPEVTKVLTDAGIAVLEGTGKIELTGSLGDVRSSVPPATSRTSSPRRCDRWTATCWSR